MKANTRERINEFQISPIASAWSAHPSFQRRGQTRARAHILIPEECLSLDFFGSTPTTLVLRLRSDPTQPPPYPKEFGPTSRSDPTKSDLVIISMIFI